MSDERTARLVEQINNFIELRGHHIADLEAAESLLVDCRNAIADQLERVKELEDALKRAEIGMNIGVESLKAVLGRSPARTSVRNSLTMMEDIFPIIDKALTNAKGAPNGR